MIIEAFLSQTRRPSVPPPLVQLGDILGDDMEAGSLVGMLSASGEGRTSMAVQVVNYAASRGHPVQILSFYQSPEQVTQSAQRNTLASIVLSLRHQPSLEEQ